MCTLVEGESWRKADVRSVPISGRYRVRRGPAPVSYPGPVTDEPADLDALVGEWLTLPDVADRLDQDVTKVRRLLQEGRLLAVRRGSPPVLSVPARFLVPGHLANPAAPGVAGAGPSWTVLAALQGTFTVLADVGFSDEGAIRWLFTPADDLDGTPMDALLAGRKSLVRRLAQAEL